MFFALDLNFLFSVFISLPRDLNLNCTAILHQPLCLEIINLVFGGSWLVVYRRVVSGVDWGLTSVLVVYRLVLSWQVGVLTGVMGLVSCVAD